MKIPSPHVIDMEILAVGSVDYLDIWFIAGTIKHVVPNADDQQVRELTIEALARLLKNGRLEAGDLYPPGEFSAWPSDAEESIQRIRDEWNGLDHPLQPGDIAWFQVVGA
jgi:hypothetical protein